MTQEQFEKAKELSQKKEQYANYVCDIKCAVNNKAYKDKEAAKNLKRYPHDHNEKWTLARFFSVLFYNNHEDKAVIGVRPHWELARPIELEADPELIDLIQKYYENKVAEIEKQIEAI